MILYFSGTGNSFYVAKKIQSITEDKIISINEFIKKNRTISQCICKEIIIL